MSKAISIKNLFVSYGKQRALEDVSFEIGEGKLVGIVGPNGSGKSTLLKAMLSIIPSESNEIHFYGKALKQAKNLIAYVPQRESVDWNFPISVEEVVMMGRLDPKKLIQRKSKEDVEIVDDTLNQVGIENLRKKQIGELSGGQQQRVFIARALAQKANLILMDEPFVGIDIASQENIIELLIALKEQGKTIVMVHHDLSTVAQYFDEVLLMNNKLVMHDLTKNVLKPSILQGVYGKLFNENQF